MTGNSTPLIWKEISVTPWNSLTEPFFRTIRMEMLFPLSTIKKFHAKIVFVAWLRDLSWEVKVVYLFFLFFQGNTSRKFWTFQLFYFPVFWLQIPYAFAIIFMACHVMAFPTWTCELHCVVSGQRFRCVGLVQKISARCKKANNTVPCVFSFFFICAFILSIDQNSNILYHYLFPRTLLFITLFLKRMFFYLLFITNRTWN